MLDNMCDKDALSVIKSTCKEMRLGGLGWFGNFKLRFKCRFSLTNRASKACMCFFLLSVNDQSLLRMSTHSLLPWFWIQDFYWSFLQASTSWNNNKSNSYVINISSISYIIYRACRFININSQYLFKMIFYASINHIYHNDKFICIYIHVFLTNVPVRGMRTMLANTAQPRKVPKINSYHV